MPRSILILPAREFSRRCKFCRLEALVASILDYVLGGQPDDFRIRSLGDRVFRFSVHSQEVGFPCLLSSIFWICCFQDFFRLWHGGGPNYRSEYKLWLDEQSFEWVDVVKKSFKSNLFSAANLVRLGADRIQWDHPFNFRNPINHVCQLVFKCTHFSVVPNAS